MQETKVCSKCKQFKMACDFGKRGDRLRSHCKACNKAYREGRKQAKELSFFAKIVGWFNR